ncbi:MAG: ATP-binding protein [Candidatus Eiseniibacteriota bacterium]
MSAAYEKLGVFYLGRTVNPAGEGAEPLLYDSKDLVTHAVCVGMTGSGKTGLGIGLLEEAALDGIPAIAIDPKGDLGNLLLTFPDLSPADFRPWIDEAEAARLGMTSDALAANRAEAWKKGLAEWDQDADRIRRFRDSTGAVIYTPGSDAGIPLRVLRSFAAPPPAVREDAEHFRECVSAAASGLLCLAGIDADPVTGREHILLANILDRAWREGEDLDLAGVIRRIQNPPFTEVGVFDLESFFPANERFALAMAVNHLLASPGFAAWMEGEALDAGRLLFGPDGKPRLSVVSIAHLGERERMFLVTMLLNEVVSWMRSQPGTGSLRAILYMDEVFGYLPPTANPPSKTPLLTLLKQARAYGVGVVLATQNPVDLDYKALSNAGTWFLGRLQTERDKLRVLDGLEGASAAGGRAFDRAGMERLLSGLGSRVFLMNDVHDDAPVLFKTRWTLSYLGGPLTRAQIGRLMAGRKAAAGGVPATVTPTAATAAAGGERPALPPGIPETFLEPAGGAGSGAPVYRPALLGRAKLHWASAAAGVDEWKDIALLSLLLDGVEEDPWASAEELPPGASLGSAPVEPCRFADVPAKARAAASYSAWAKALAAHLYQDRPVVLRRSPDLRLTSRPGEAEGDFRARLSLVLRERRDDAVAKLRQRYEPKVAQLQERIRTAGQRVERESAQKSQQQLSTAVAVGATVLGALFGRKKLSVGTVGRASTAMRSAGRAQQEAGDVQRAEESLEATRQRLAALEEEVRSEVAKLEGGVDASALPLEEVVVRAKKTDLVVQPVALAWTPWRAGAEGALVPDFTRASGDDPRSAST